MVVNQAGFLSSPPTDDFGTDELFTKFPFKLPFDNGHLSKLDWPVKASLVLAKAHLRRWNKQLGKIRELEIIIPLTLVEPLTSFLRIAFWKIKADSCARTGIPNRDQEIQKSHASIQAPVIILNPRHTIQIQAWLLTASPTCRFSSSLKIFSMTN